MPFPLCCVVNYSPVAQARLPHVVYTCTPSVTQYHPGPVVGDKPIHVREITNSTHQVELSEMGAGEEDVNANNVVTL